MRDRDKQQRFASHLPAIQELARGPASTPQLPVQRATEVFYTLMSEETYGLLVAEHGWSVPDWSGWALRHIRAELFPGLSLRPKRRWATLRGWPTAWRAELRS